MAGYLDQIHPALLDDINRRKEFAIYTNVPPTVNDAEPESNIVPRFLLKDVVGQEYGLTLHSYQLFVRNFLNPNTPYTRLFLQWSPGMGKTIASLSIALNFINYYNKEQQSGAQEIGSVWIVGFTENIFKADLVKFSEFGFITEAELHTMNKLKELVHQGSAYDLERLNELRIRINKRLTNRQGNGFFKFIGYKALLNRLFLSRDKDIQLPNLSENEIAKCILDGKIILNKTIMNEMKNSLIICDEIHNVYNSAEKNNWGVALQTILNYDPSVRALFLSATPLNNNPTELIDLLNLLTPRTDFPEFKRSDFFMSDNQLRADKIDELRHILSGRVSFITNNDQRYFPAKGFIGEKIPGISYLKFIRCEMSKFHYNTYKNVLTGVDTTLSTDGQYITDFVLPDPVHITAWDKPGLYKTHDIRNKYLHISPQWRKRYRLAYDIDNDVLTGDILNLNNNLSNISAKYARLVRDIINCVKNKKGKIFIYHNVIHMSGVLFIGEILKINGFIDESSDSTDNTICSVCGERRSQHSKEQLIIGNLVRLNPNKAKGGAGEHSELSELGKQTKLQSEQTKPQSEPHIKHQSEHYVHIKTPTYEYAIKKFMYDDDQIRFNFVYEPFITDVAHIADLCNNFKTNRLDVILNTKNENYEEWRDQLIAAGFKINMLRANHVYASSNGQSIDNALKALIIKFLEQTIQRIAEQQTAEQQIAEQQIAEQQIAEQQTTELDISGGRSSRYKHHRQHAQRREQSRSRRASVLAKRSEAKRDVRSRSRSEQRSDVPVPSRSRSEQRSKLHTFIPCRYTLVHSDISRKVINRNLEAFNSITNVEGETIMILVGGRIMKESINLVAVRNMFIAGRPDNIPTMLQIIGRTVRTNSHITLPPHQRIVNISIYVSSLPTKELSYEEQKYKEKIESFKTIQKIELLFHEVAIDKTMNHGIIFQPKSKLQEQQHYELDILPYQISKTHKYRLDELNLETFNAYYNDQEVKDIKLVIKKLFIVMSPTWKYKDLLRAVMEHKDMERDMTLISEKNFMLALDMLLIKDNDKYSEPHIQELNKAIESQSLYKKLTNPMDKFIYMAGNQKMGIVHIGEYYIMMPINHVDNSIGTDIEVAYRQDQPFVDKSVGIKNYLLYDMKTNYTDKKAKFIKKWEHVDIRSLEMAICDYGVAFHKKLAEDCIEYMFNMWTDPKQTKSPHHIFYIKMIYYYDLRKVIIWAHTVSDKLFAQYKEWAIPIVQKLERGLKVSKIQDSHLNSTSGFLNLLKTSINKNNTEWMSTGMVNDFNHKIKESLALYDGNIKKSRAATKIKADYLPIGHFIGKIPRFYNPRRGGWYDDMTYMEHTTQYKENNIVIGYDDRSKTGINVKFKLRSPIQNIKQHRDVRQIEKGSICTTKNKPYLRMIAKKLDINDPHVMKDSTDILCMKIRTRLIYYELKARSSGSNIKYFYFLHEIKPETQFA